MKSKSCENNILWIRCNTVENNRAKESASERANKHRLTLLIEMLRFTSIHDFSLKRIRKRFIRLMQKRVVAISLMHALVTTEQYAIDFSTSPFKLNRFDRFQVRSSISFIFLFFFLFFFEKRLRSRVCNSQYSYSFYYNIQHNQAHISCTYRETDRQSDIQNDCEQESERVMRKDNCV